jgi:ribosomal protein L32
MKAAFHRDGGITRMTEVLSQEEIDQLLNAMNSGEPEPFTLVKFEKSLAERKFEPEEPYGHYFDPNISMCRFRSWRHAENVLADIEKKNKEEGMGNITIPHTRIKLINFSVCPKCKTIFSYKDLMNYYKNPKPDSQYTNKTVQLREDTRVCCANCGEYFLPAIVISDGTPKNETQFLCRIQTINALEEFYAGLNMKVLTKQTQNVIQRNGRKGILNDVLLKELEAKPTLITNLVQYTPPSLIENLIDGTNKVKGDILYGAWCKQ